jgi:23S rRNA (uracil1939-C5)-methyltransferase
VVDPPRAGLSTGLRRILPHLRPHTLMYVSCNPQTCLRDCQDLVRQGYRITTAQGIDMFPHTYHCEMIIRLENG